MDVRRMALLVIFGAAAMVSAQLVAPYPTYPRLDVDPSVPVVGDTVRLHYVKGRLPAGCVPSYADRTVHIEMSPLAVYPPQYIVYLSYKESDIPRHCTGDSVEYGPSFELTDVPVGNYDVRDAMNFDSTVGSFRVSEPFAIRGVVTDDPGTCERMPKPLEGVLVQVATDHYPVVYAKSSAAIYPYYTHFYDSTRTAADGSYELTRVPRGRYRATFSKRGFVVQTAYLTLAADTVLDVKLLPEGALGTVAGTVQVVVPGPTPTSPVTFAPCARCTVSVFCHDIIVPLEEPVAYSAAKSAMCMAYQAVTDKDGRFEADSIRITRSGEPVTVAARRSGYTTATVDTAIHYMITTTVNLTLTPETSEAGAAPQMRSRPSVRFLHSSRAVRVTLDRRQMLHVSLHTLDGRLVRGMGMSRTFGVGTHAIRLADRLPPGVYLIRVRGTTVDATIRARVQ